MFGSRGFSNSLGDDILSSFISDTAKKAQTNNSSQGFDNNEKHLLSTKKAIQQIDEEDDFGKTRKTIVKTTSSLAQNNIIKKNSGSDKKSNDVDDLLDLIEEAKGDKPASRRLNDSSKDPKPAVKPSTTSNIGASTTGSKINAPTNMFAAELSDSDDDLNNAGYDPTVRETSNKKSVTSSEDIQKRKSALFGISNTSITAGLGNKSQMTDSDTQGLNFGSKLQRPQTTEAKPTKVDDDEIGEINIGFSRRGKTAAAKERPSTTPASTNIKPIQETKAKFNFGEEEEDDDVNSEYLNTIASRTDKKDQKKSLGSNLKLPSSSMATTGKTGTFPIDVKESATPEFSLGKDGFYAAKEMTVSQILEEKKDGTASIVRNPVGILGKKELLEPQNPLGQAKSVASIGNPLLRNRVDGHGFTASSQFSGGSGVGEGSLKDGLPVFGQEGYMKETEEHYKRRSKDVEEYYENRYKQLKASLEDEKRKWEDLHEKEKRLLKKEADDVKENMNKQLERERERMKEMFNLELESKEKIHRFELERQRHIFEDENESLKKQLEAQAKLNALADEIKQNSKKLLNLSNQMETEKDAGTFGMKGELKQKEKKVEEMEKRLAHELEIVNNEKKRIEKIREELDVRGSEDRDLINKEKEHLRQEFTRLHALQDAVRRQELEKVRNLEKEKARYEHERALLEKEESRLKEEYSTKFHDLEMQVELYEIRAREFEKVMEMAEVSLKQKQDQMEASMKKMVIVETNLIAKVKDLEHKEILVNKNATEVQSRLNILELEKITFEKEKREVHRLADQAREDGDKLRQFRRDFETEQYKNMRLKTHMAGLVHNLEIERAKLDKEKLHVTQIQKTLDGVKKTYVNDLDMGKYPKPTWAESNYEGKNQEYLKRRTHSGAYGGSAWTSPSKGNKQELIHERRKSVAPEEKTGGAIKIISGTRDQENNLKTWQKNNAARPVGEGSVQTPLLDAFNYGNYMKQLKTYDQVANYNQNYITSEREDLKKTKEEVNKMSPQRIQSAFGASRKAGGYSDYY